MIENLPNCVTLVMSGGGDIMTVLCWLGSHWSLLLDHVKFLVVKVSVAGYSSHFTVRKAPGPTKVQGRFSIAFYRGTGNSQRFII